MKIAILTTHPIQYYAPFFRALAKQIDIRVFYFYKPDAHSQGAQGFEEAFEWDLDLLSGYPYTFVPNQAKNPSSSDFWGCDSPKIYSFLKSEKFDAVITIGWHIKALLQGVLAAKRLGVPVIIRGDSQLQTPRSWVKGAIKQLVYPWFLRIFDAALSVGARNRDYFLNYNYPQSRIFFAPHSVDNERFRKASLGRAREEARSRLGIQTDQKVILFAGKLVEFKRPLDAVKVTANVRSRGWNATLVVAGSGALSTIIRDSSSSIGIPIKMLGFQNQTEMPSVYAAADVLLLPSNGRETWGLVCNEALATGTPIVVSDQAGCAMDLGIHSTIGSSFSLGDIAQAADRVEDVFNTPPSLSEVLTLSDNFSIQASIEGTLRALRSVCKTAKSKGAL